MADDTTIIEGTVKFRDGKKWKPRWCVMRKLSPVADCVHLQLYRDARARWAAGSGGGGGCKAALSLAQYVGCEAGFTLDKHSNTLALVCRDLVAVLAFDARERLIQWQVKVNRHLGEARQHVVVVVAGGAGGARRVPAGPARLLLRAGRCALTAGAPPRLLGVWELHHLRRFGVVDGRFCFEGGAACGRGEGLHVLVSDAPASLARDFELAARGLLSPPQQEDAEGPESRPGTRLWAPERCASPGAEAASGDTVSVRGAEGPEPRAGVTLERCMSCMSKLGALSRSSTAALSPGGQHFSPAWTMEALREAEPPPPPPRPAPCPCACDSQETRSMGIGPYENYDVPRVPSTEVEGEYYDTPKRLKECIDDDLFRMTKSSTSSTLILKKPCGCLLKLGRRRREPTIVDSEESFQPPGCPCRRVTAWAHSWMRLPTCRRGAPAAPDKENVAPPKGTSLYATIDVSRKSRRRAEVDEGPLANYENLSFALSLEHYENARDVLRRAGVTRSELDAIGANLRPGSLATGAGGRGACERCGRAPRAGAGAGDYLLMEPAAVDPGRGGRRRSPPAGYTPMSPVGGFALHPPRRPQGPSARPLEKSASNPALGAGEVLLRRSPPPRPSRRPRSSSADSSRFLDELEEAGGAGERGSASSVETLRDAGGARFAGAPAAGVGGGGGAGAAAGGNRDSSSSNDSGVSSCSLRPGEGAPFELPPTTRAARRHYRRSTPALPPPRRSRSWAAASAPAPAPAPESHKCSSAGAEVPLLSGAPLRGPGSGVGGGAGGGRAADAHSSSSGASDMSDYIETLSLCSSHSSADTPLSARAAAARRATSTLRPRSGGEYLSLAPPAPPVRPPRPRAPHTPALVQDNSDRQFLY